MKKILLLLFATSALLTARGQSTASIRNFSVADGLAANIIAGMEHDSRGLMWLATWNGLCCYDGYQFTTFRTGGPTDDENALTTNRLAMIRVDSRDNLWVRTYDGGLYLFDTHQCRFVNVGRIIEKHFGRPIKSRNIYPMPSGHTWITDADSVLNLRVDDSHPTDPAHMQVLGDKEHPLWGQYIRKVESDNLGREWIVTDRGRMLYGTDKHARHQEQQAGGGQSADTALVWRLQAAGISRSDIDKYHIDQQGNLWLTSPRGVTLVNFHDNHFRLLPLVDKQHTRSVACRRDGTVWAGSSDGYIGIFDGHQQLGWLGTNGRLSTTRTRFSDRIYALYETRDGSLWIGTKGDGLYVVTPQGAVRHYLPDEADPYAVSCPDIYAFDEDADGRLWVGTFGGGLNLAERQASGPLRFIHAGNEMKGYPIDDFQKIRRITHDDHGNIILSTTAGIVTFNSHRNTPAGLQFHTTTRRQPNDSTSLLSTDVLQTLICQNGTVYVTTMGGGIQELASRPLLAAELLMKPARSMGKDPSNALSLTEDRQGNIWIARESGIACYQPASDQLFLFGPSDMGENVEPSEAQPAVDADGRIWMGVMGGLLVFSPSSIRKSSYCPNIIFTSVQYQGEQETIQPLLYQDRLTVAPHQRNLTIRFAALDYEDNTLLQYAYKMAGRDHAWNYIGHTPVISFSQLPPGRHTLIVKSTNCDGVWVDNEMQLIIDVTPLPWEHMWVQLLALLAVIALTTWGIVSYKKRRDTAREQERRLEHVLRQYSELQQAVAEKEQDAPAPASQEAAPAGAPLHMYKLEVPQIVDADEEMMSRLMQFIGDHIAEEGLKIDDMAEAVGLGRTVFYGKMKSLMGMSPSDFLRHVRMQRAQEFIRRSRMNISEVAYAVGFTDPKYFTKCFKKDTGMTPSEFRENSRAASAGSQPPA